MTTPPEGDRIACEDLTSEAIARYAAKGYALAFAEDVMRCDLAALRDLPAAPLPAGIILAPWGPDSIPAFYSAYSAAFADRPGFPGWSQEQWVDWTAGDPTFRPHLSWVALADDEPVGFITCAEEHETATQAPTGFIIQVGTRLSWRGQGIASALVTRVLEACQAEGYGTAILDVNVNNPIARRLYERLGFMVIRRRGVFLREA